MLLIKKHLDIPQCLRRGKIDARFAWQAEAAQCLQKKFASLDRSCTLIHPDNLNWFKVNQVTECCTLIGQSIKPFDWLKCNLVSTTSHCHHGCLARGGGVHNMIRVRVCAAHMGGFLGPIFSKEGSFFGRFSSKMGVFD